MRSRDLVFFSFYQFSTELVPPNVENYSLLLIHPKIKINKNFNRSYNNIISKGQGRIILEKFLQLLVKSLPKSFNAALYFSDF